MKKRRNPNLSRIWLLIPKVFLKHFDEAVQTTFPSRAEAIRRGMNLVLEEVRQFKAEESANQPNQSEAVVPEETKTELSG